MQKRWNFILYCKLIWENHWLRCTSPPASGLCAWDHTLSLMLRGWINFSKHLALLALQLDAAAILANLLFTSCETKKLHLSFNFLSSAYKSLPMFLKWATRRFPSGYTCGAFAQTCAAQVASAQRPFSMNPWLDGRGKKNPQIYPAGNFQLTMSTRLDLFLLAQI